MVTIGDNYRVLPGKEKAFESVFFQVMDALKTLPGHKSSRMFREVADAAHYLILSEWSDRASFDAFLASEAFKNTASLGREQLLAGRPTHVYYEH